MQIHELNNYVGSLGDSAYLPVDNGQDTGKLAYSDLFSTGERTMLWSGSAYSIGAEIDLSESANNFEYIEIFLVGETAQYESVIIPTPLNSNIMLSQAVTKYQLSTPSFIGRTVTLSCTDTKLTITESRDYKLAGTTPTISVDSPASLYIYRVDGINTAARNKSVVEVKQVTLAAADWADNEQTVTVEDVTATNSVLVCAAPASQTDFMTYGVSCTGQGDGSLTFICASTPTSDLTVNVMVVG